MKNKGGNCKQEYQEEVEKMKVRVKERRRGEDVETNAEKHLKDWNREKQGRRVKIDRWKQKKGEEENKDK